MEENGKDRFIYSQSYYFYIMNIEEMKVENMKANVNITATRLERFHQADFNIIVKREPIDYGYERKPGKVECYIKVAGIRFMISEDSAVSILSEMQRLGISGEGVRVEYGGALPKKVSSRRGITMEDIEKKLKEKGMSLEEIEGIKKGDDGGGELKVEGFGDFTIVRDHPGYIDIRYKGESIRGVVGATVKAFSEDKDYAVLVLEIMENIPSMTAKKEGLPENES